MSAKDRDSFLIARRNLKMARSPEAYTRGTTRLFYNWLADTLSQSLTDPPCGSVVIVTWAISGHWRIATATLPFRSGISIRLSLAIPLTIS